MTPARNQFVTSIAGEVCEETYRAHSRFRAVRLFRAAKAAALERSSLGRDRGFSGAAS